VAFYEEYAIANAPAKVNHFGEELLGPTLIAFGTPEQQQRFLPRILDVTELWCAGLFRTRRRQRPGQRVDHRGARRRRVGDQRPEGVDVAGALGAVVLRAGAQRKRLPSVTPGCRICWCRSISRGSQVRPIVQLTGDSEFNEVFFDDARTDADLVVGQPGDGWRVAMGTLTFERGVSTLGQQIVYSRELSAVVELAKSTGAADDPLIRERLTRSWAGLRAMRSYALATMDVEQPGQDNVSKLLWANWHRDLGEIAMDVQGKRAWCWPVATSTSGSGSTCSPARTPSTAAPTRSSATSSPSACSVYPGRLDDARRCAERSCRTRTSERQSRRSSRPRPAPGSGRRPPGGRSPKAPTSSSPIITSDGLAKRVTSCPHWDWAGSRAWCATSRPPRKSTP
jgi:alkylation response protein AidB-like acyl-CoA dehydrogenase